MTLTFPLFFQNLQLGCGCLQSTCCPKTCDHVYLFNNDYENAKDKDGKLMEGRFPYDHEGRLLLEVNILLWCYLFNYLFVFIYLCVKLCAVRSVGVGIDGTLKLSCPLNLNFYNRVPFRLR